MGEPVVFVARHVVHRELARPCDLFPQIVEHEYVALLHAFVVSGIREFEGQDPKVGEVLPVDPRERDSDHNAKPEEARCDGGMLT